MKKMSTSLEDAKQNHNEIPLHTIRKATIKKSGYSSVDKDAEEPELSHLLVEM